jgi:cell fate regulator YaaT (PSP1 superfamily)
MPEVVEVRFKGSRKAFFTWDHADPPTMGSDVVVQLERGQDLGRVTAVGEAAAKKCGVGCDGCALTKPQAPEGQVLRNAGREESHVAAELRKAEDDIRRTVMDKAKSHQLGMKVTDAEWQWDRKKLTVYFTAEQRVDFRGLVKELASLFRTRIELRQIGARDEAKRLSGVGRCGREYCCSSWLPELQPVSLGLAKDQKLSLNPSQISGGCGRLLCCLRYEHDFYVQARKRFPKEGKTVRTAAGNERVHAIDIFRERVLLRAEDGGSRSLTLGELKVEMGAAEPAPPPPPEPPRPPSGLATFTDSGTPPTTEQATEAVTPRRKRRRRGRRGRGGPDA